jgi:hypothetical protein
MPGAFTARRKFDLPLRFNDSGRERFCAIKNSNRTGKKNIAKFTDLWLHTV